MNNTNENLKPKQEIVQNQNIVENKEIEELKRENEGYFEYIVEYLSKQCENMKKNDRLKKLLENIKILKEKTYEINFKYNIFKEDTILKRERYILKELKEFILDYKTKNIFNIIEKYESKEEFKKEERSDYELVDELYEKLEKLKRSYEVVLNNCKDYEVNKKNEDIYFNYRDLTLGDKNDLNLIPKEDLIEYEKVKNEFDIKNENINLFFTLMERLNVECEKMRKNIILKKILFNLIAKRQRYIKHVVRLSEYIYNFEKEANLLKEIEDVLNSFNSEFFKFAEIYELGQKLDDECFLRVKDLYNKLEDLTKFYEEDNQGRRKLIWSYMNYVGDENNLILNKKLLKRYIISRIEEVDEYYEFFMDCFYKIAEYLNGFSFEKPKNFIKENDDKPITIFKDVKEKKENLKYKSFMDLYLKFYDRRNFFKRVLAKCYRLHLCFAYEFLELYDLVLKEKQNLKYLFSYLENLVRCYNLDNVKSFRNKLNLEEQFNPNNEFNKKYDPDSKESYPVEFKYNVYDIAEEFYEKNSKKWMKNFFSRRIMRNLPMSVRRRMADAPPDEVTITINKHMFKIKKEVIDYLKKISQYERHSVFVKFFKQVFKNLEDEMKKGDYSKNYVYKKLKGLINTLLHMETYKYSKFEDEFKNENLLLLGKDFTRFERFCDFFKDKRKKNKELYNFLIKYSKDKEKEIINDEDLYDFLVKYSKHKEKFLELENSSKEIAGFFSNELKNELKKIKNEPVKGRNLLTGRSTDYPTMLKGKHTLNLGEDFNYYITNHLNNEKDVEIEDSNFNEIFEKIESLVDKEGNLKRNFVNVERRYESEALNELSEKLSELIRFLIEGINLYRPLEKS